MKTHELTKNTAGQSQPHGSHGYVYDCWNTMEHTNAKQMLIHGQDTGQRLQNATDQTSSWP